MDHISTRTIPTIVDYTTEEYSINEQLQLLTQAIQDLPQYHFLVKASGKEGQLAAPLKMLDISHLDQGIYPDQACVAEACRRLIERSGFSKEQVLTEIKQRISKPVNKKQVKAAKESVINNTRHGKPDHDLPVTTTTPVPATPPAEEAKGTDDEPVFQ
jgi:hypothetical protein